MFKKIDLFLRAFQRKNYVYECSTNTYRTCAEAKKSFCLKHGLDASQVKASFAK